MYVPVPAWPFAAANAPLELTIGHVGGAPAWPALVALVVAAGVALLVGAWVDARARKAAAAPTPGATPGRPGPGGGVLARFAPAPPPAAHFLVRLALSARRLSSFPGPLRAVARGPGSRASRAA